MFKRINQFILPSFCLLLLLSAGCQKGTFDINDINPNVPSNVSPKFILSGALMRSAQIMAGGDADFAELYMGYWSVSGDYIPVTSTLTYQTTTGYYSDNWDGSYQLLKNYRQIEQLASADPNLTNYVAMGKIMESFHFERLVDMYNNIPYSQALQGGTINYPTYDDAATVYAGVIGTLDTAIQLIHAAPATAESPGAYDILFQGSMTLWEEF
ncbi:MAG TPA: SusD/RagB family nutrient-binding outer membrane lipoprotein, partial [Puia sp.]|nr:SusD/RagB family nutrient-binding outer membrane lipoprotein [Puia sp.]